MRSERKIVWFGVFICFLSLRASLGDSPSPPTDFEAFSENGRIVAYITLGEPRLITRDRVSEPPGPKTPIFGPPGFGPPGFGPPGLGPPGYGPPPGNRQPAKLSVYSVERDERTLLWETDLSNKTSPADVYVSDDGEYAVTLDNWACSGYGNNVLAFYDSNGLIRKYSLEEIFGLKGESANEYFKKKIIHTAASRLWRLNNIEFFDNIDGLFCMWVIWEGRWLAWELASGNPVDASQEQLLRWNTKAREKMLSLIEEEKWNLQPYEFLGKLKVPQDRPLIEKLLKDRSFCTDFDTVSVDNKVVDFRYCSSSEGRSVGDRILSNWENLGEPCDYVVKEEMCVCTDEKYTFLGSLNLTVSYAKAPHKGEGSLRIYVIPYDSGANEPQVSKSDAYLIADLKFDYTYYNAGNHSIFENPNETPATSEASRYPSLGKTVKFSIQGITPGRYKAVAIWDRVAPFCPKDRIECIAQRGDYISSKNPEVIIKAGETVENVNISCTKLVK